MRVIAGVARSLPLKTPEGMGTRPTTDRIKETLFNMLQPYIGDGVFVDVSCAKVVHVWVPLVFYAFYRPKAFSM